VQGEHPAPRDGSEAPGRGAIWLHDRLRAALRRRLRQLTSA
jgi:hypothetical protein